MNPELRAKIITYNCQRAKDQRKADAFVRSAGAIHGQAIDHHDRQSQRVLKDEYKDGNFSRRDEQVKSTNTLFNELLTSEKPEVIMTVLKEKEATE